MFFRERQSLIVTVAVLYVCPLLILSGLSASLFSPDRSFSLLALGLFITSLGSLALFWLIEKRENQISEEVNTLAEIHAQRATEPPVETPREQETNEETLIELETLKKDKEKLIHRMDDLLHEFQQYQETANAELEHQKSLYKECQETINEQRTVINRKQSQISEFESKIHDLNYEVKTLLKLADIGKTSTPAPKIKEPSLQHEPELPKNSPLTDEQAKLELKRCIDIAQKITGASPFGGGGLRFRELNIDNYALDLRRLYDALKNETVCPILVWSQKENKLLFANQEIKTLLGWSPEQFVQDFRSIASPSLHDWQDGIGSLSGQRETTMRLSMKAKTGQTLPVYCHLRIIPSGLFRSHAIGLLHY